MKNTFIILTVLFIVAGAWISFLSYEHGQDYQNEKTAYVKELNFEDRLLRAKEWIFTESEWAKRKEKSDFHLKAAMIAYDRMILRSVVLMVLIIVYVLIVIVIALQRKQVYLFLGIAFAVVSFPCLIAGVTVPMMEISAFNTELTIPLELKAGNYIKNVPLLEKYADLLTFDLTQVFHGRMYYFYQSKSVMNLILLLVKDGNWLVAISILIFSIILPVFKLMVTLWNALANQSGRRQRIFNFAYALGKWSMADVFVAAIFLGFLSFSNMNEGVETEALTLPGMYYFLGYCILSLVSSILINAALKQKERSATLSEEP